MRNYNINYNRKAREADYLKPKRAEAFKFMVPICEEFIRLHDERDQDIQRFGLCYIAVILGYEHSSVSRVAYLVRPTKNFLKEFYNPKQKHSDYWWPKCPIDERLAYCKYVVANYKEDTI